MNQETKLPETPRRTTAAGVASPGRPLRGAEILEAALTRRARRVREAAMEEVPASVSLSLRITRRWMALMDAAIAQRTGVMEQYWEASGPVILLGTSNIELPTSNVEGRERRAA